VKSPQNTKVTKTTWLIYVKKINTAHIHFIKYKVIIDYACQYYKQNMF
jgi:hypothetical protein